MFSVLLVDVDPIRALDLFVRLEDEGFEVFGPVASTGEGFRHINERNLNGVVMDGALTRKFFPELYDAIIASKLPIAFLDKPADSSDTHKVDWTVFNIEQPTSALNAFFKKASFGQGRANDVRDTLVTQAMISPLPQERYPLEAEL